MIGSIGICFHLSISDTPPYTMKDLCARNGTYNFCTEFIAFSMAKVLHGSCFDVTF
jgi:hypothetical protein